MNDVIEIRVRLPRRLYEKAGRSVQKLSKLAKKKFTISQYVATLIAFHFMRE